MADLQTSVIEGVGVITLNRPHRRNALSDEMVAALGQTLADWETDASIGAVVLTGAGGGFCAGGDVKDFAARGGLNDGLDEVSPARVEWLRTGQRESVVRLHAYTKPVIAAVPGAAAGAGLGLALACDLRVGTENSVFTTAFAGIGLSGDYGVTWLLSRCVGPARARRMLFFGERISGEQALTWGLLDWLVEPDDLLNWALTFATRLAAGPRFALSQMKRNLAFAELSELEESCEFEALSQVESGAHPDHQEAIEAFLAKREPRYPATSPAPQA